MFPPFGNVSGYILSLELAKPAHSSADDGHSKVAVNGSYDSSDKMAPPKADVKYALYPH